MTNNFFNQQIYLSFFYYKNLRSNDVGADASVCLNKNNIYVEYFI